MTNEFTPAGSGAGPAAVAPREPRIVDPGRGASWWGEGWRLFMPDVGVWLLIMLILIVIHVCGAFIPVVGSLALQILFPVFSGGLMLGCRALDRGNPLTVGHLFGGFSQRTGPLVVVGLIYTGLAILMVLIVAGMMIAIFGVAILGMLTGAVDPSQTGIALGSVVVAVLLGILFFLLLLLPLVMAIWFAPALVMLGALSPGAAMKASFYGCLRNVIPFLVYGAIGIVLAIIATIPLGLGWFVLGPVAIASVYASYCDIFEDKSAP
ncbi:MAG: hypothetical protein AUH79_07470 [Betaproteobacteria bacterium 13_1_40CM_4_64_4]|nr:MAG: hypothetical protein AUH79_07470 [Betaproteobacteria bacterium 13_1_40CM_4_64_4]